MAGKEDKAKKRKRDVAEAVARSKRHRTEKKEQKKGSRRDSTALTNGNNPEVEGRQDDGPRELELNREFDNGEAGWRISKPIGGRMLDIDPILTDDEQHLIIAYHTSVQVYSAADSLLVRRIPITTLSSSESVATEESDFIVAMKRSIQNPNFLWVLTLSGQVFHIDWTRASTAPKGFSTSTRKAHDMAVASSSSDASGDALLVLETDDNGYANLNVYAGTTKDSVQPQNVFSMKAPDHGFMCLSANTNGQVVCGALGDRLFIASWESLDKEHCETFSFKVPDMIASLDVRVEDRTNKHLKNKQSYPGSNVVVDVVVGGARGAIYRYSDLLAGLHSPEKAKAAKKDLLQAQKYHWHRRAVHAVKWSRDGNYLISGGSEDTLVIWQLDTGHKNFLPHLSGVVENIVVSPRGSSYVVHLDDNSTMVLSTAELKPTAYVSGIQSATTYVTMPKDLLVRRQWAMAGSMRRKIPVAINPTDASRLHVCVGPGQQATLTGDYSAPLLQTIDLQSFTSVSTQALTRTNPTDMNVNAEGKPPSEPRITHISYSNNGKWLASVDEWQPSDNEADNVNGDQKEQFTRERLEVFLKFWEVKEDGTLSLVSRINGPHSSTSPEKVLDLASSPAASCFATLGGDAKLRLWRSRTHKGRDTAAKEQVDVVSWANSLVVPLSDMVSEDVMIEDEDNPAPVSAPRKGCIEFSEDGSTLFAAYGTEENGAVNIIDVASGDVIDSIEGLWKGDLQAIGVVSPYLIVLSDELRVFDIVSDELRYAIQIPSDLGTKDLLSLAVDRETGHFAVSLPIGRASSIGIFDPENPEPLLVRSTPQQIISLVSSPNSSGFVAIDDAAQVWTIAEGSDPSSISALQPLEDLRLEEGAVAQINGAPDGSRELTMTLGDDGEASDEEQAADADVAMGDEDDEDDSRPRVIPQQALTDIFDAAPNYQAANVEDLFYKVVALTQQTR
ncbi:hypothetical protein NLU13_8163 [Sarocladium strictum]|uniref:Uncharacterized protein n=1 Tax=Sarocladium strictum TaxID=5046 RepID=A0AA39GBS6_SARSR|nr:hypothetical protein NLU13_8163 [Sarocladium strictum]